MCKCARSAKFPQAKISAVQRHHHTSPSAGQFLVPRPVHPGGRAPQGQQIWECGGRGGGGGLYGARTRRTIERRETAVEDELQIAEVALGEGESGKGLGLGGELVLARGVAGEKVLEDTSVRGEGHLESGYRGGGKRNRQQELGSNGKRVESSRGSHARIGRNKRVMKGGKGVGPGKLGAKRNLGLRFINTIQTPVPSVHRMSELRQSWRRLARRTAWVTLKTVVPVCLFSGQFVF